MNKILEFVHKLIHRELKVDGGCKFCEKIIKGL